MSRNQYQIFQIRPENGLYNQRGKTYAQQIADGFLIRRENYTSVYKSSIVALDTPDSVRRKLENNKPNTFISNKAFGVSDVILWSESDTMRFYYVEKERLVEFGGFLPLTGGAEGNTATFGVPYQVDGKTGSWVAVDSEIVEGVSFYLLQNEQYKDNAAQIIVDEKCSFVMEASNGFDTNVRDSLAAYLQKDCQPEKEQQAQHQKNLADNVSVQASEGKQTAKETDVKSSVPKKPRVINGRTSVLDRLHIKQAQRAQTKAEQAAQKERNRK